MARSRRRIGQLRQPLCVSSWIPRTDPVPVVGDARLQMARKKQVLDDDDSDFDL